MQRKSRVIILPAINNEANASIGLFVDTNKLLFRTKNDIPRGIGQHLYILSDEEIREGDWCVNIYSKLVIQCTKENYGSNAFDFFKKIIGTTDPSLWNIHPKDDGTGWPEDLNRPKIPSLSSDFIAAYIKAYNAGSPIVECMVEYETVIKDTNVVPSHQEGIHIPKLRQPENSLIIHPVKEKMYTEAQVDQIISDLGDYFNAILLIGRTITPSTTGRQEALNWWKKHKNK